MVALMRYMPPVSGTSFPSSWSIMSPGVNHVYLFWTENADYWEDVSGSIDQRIAALSHHDSVNGRIDRIAEHIRAGAAKPAARVRLMPKPLNTSDCRQGQHDNQQIALRCQVDSGRRLPACCYFNWHQRPGVQQAWQLTLRRSPIS